MEKLIIYTEMANLMYTGSSYIEIISTQMVRVHNIILNWSRKFDL